MLRKMYLLFFISSLMVATTSCSKDDDKNDDNGGGVTDKIVDHRCTDLSKIPTESIEKAKEDLYIVYGHTSHGSQLITGMNGLNDFKNTDLYSFNNEGSNGALHLHDGGVYGDLGNPNRTAWAQETREYIADHPDVNVVIWSWCGQASTATEEDINTYLNLMDGLEKDFPAIQFIYMTGHLDGTGETGNLHVRNEQIRSFCETHGKFLYDFADIESYDPEGNYYLDKLANDGCNYDSDGDGRRDKNWAVDWQNSHTEGVDWYECESAHSEPLNANRKAYAAWWLWARLAGWDGN